jgi:hypothetical protein
MRSLLTSHFNGCSNGTSTFVDGTRKKCN